MQEDREIAVLQQCFQELKTLDEGGRRRIIAWLADRFGVVPVSGHKATDDNGAPALANEEKTDANSEKTGTESIFGHYTHLKEFLLACQPDTDAERVLLTTAWLQFADRQQVISGRKVNDALKKIDKGVKNITSTLQLLERKQPPLIAASSQRQHAQKEYKATETALDYIRNKLDYMAG